MQLKDLLYFDFEKAASLWSQLEGGLLGETATQKTKSGDVKAKIKVSLGKLAEGEAGGGGGIAVSTVEKKNLHHNLLNYLERELNDSKLVADLSFETLLSMPDGAAMLRDRIGKNPYLKCTGWASLEDYGYMADFVMNFNNLANFIHKTSVSGSHLDAAPASFKETRRIATSKKSAASRSDQRGSLADLSPHAIQPWLQNGIKLILESFYRDQLILRLKVSDKCPDFEVVCNLKKSNFLDDDLAHLLYGYGRHPNVQLSAFGLLTSIPSSDGDEDLRRRFSVNAAGDGENIPGSFDASLRSVFSALDELKDLTRTYRYPSVALHPIAVYRQIV